MATIITVRIETGEDDAIAEVTARLEDVRDGGYDISWDTEEGAD